MYDTTYNILLYLALIISEGPHSFTDPVCPRQVETLSSVS